MTRFSLQDPDLFRRQAYVGGQWCDADNGATLEVNNPATGEILGTVPMMGTAETRRAIEAAKGAWGEWRRKPAKDRSALLRKWHELMLANLEDLGKLMTAEQGKPLAEAKGEVAYAASFIEWFAEEAKRVYGDTIPSPWNDRRLVVIKESIGVCAALTPWNFPAAMITRKAPLFSFDTDEEAIQMANDTEFGLASYFYSRDIGRIWRAAEGLESGMVGINTGLISNEVAPFGGVKQSGLGREGSHYGIEEFVEVKYLCFGGLNN
jgi:acyl-CoA reductase-like NAD-dependent aldehyde dehydrogenase